jgi:hypothetical protein
VRNSPKINQVTPPKPELVSQLGKMIAANPEFFNVEAKEKNRFDKTRDGGKNYTGYGYKASIDRDPRFLLYFVVADVHREGLKPVYLKKLYQVWKDNPKWFNREESEPAPSDEGDLS